METGRYPSLCSLVGSWCLLWSQQDHTMLIQEAIDSPGTKPANPNLFPNQEYSPSSQMKEENRQS